MALEIGFMDVVLSSKPDLESLGSHYTETSSEKLTITSDRQWTRGTWPRERRGPAKRRRRDLPRRGNPEQRRRRCDASNR